MSSLYLTNGWCCKTKWELFCSWSIYEKDCWMSIWFPKLPPTKIQKCTCKNTELWGCYLSPDVQIFPMFSRISIRQKCRLEEWLLGETFLKIYVSVVTTEKAGYCEFRKCRFVCYYEWWSFKVTIVNLHCICNCIFGWSKWPKSSL